jgi:hypothetical protein
LDRHAFSDHVQLPELIEAVRVAASMMLDVPEQRIVVKARHEALLSFVGKQLVSLGHGSTTNTKYIITLKPSLMIERET